MISISKLPSTGLGNKLFAWAAGAVFAKTNNCKHVVIGMTRFHIGPYIRKERSKRFYNGYFKNEKKFIFLKLKKTIILSQIECSNITTHRGSVIFKEIPHWDDYFVELKKHRIFLKEYFYSSLNGIIAAKIDKLPSPEIGVHIRMGDFRELRSDEDFANVGLVRTPLTYFINTINKLRKFLDKDISVTIFSDGNDEDLKEILSMENVIRQYTPVDIIDLISLSKSKVLITSAGSTFSKWAGFLSENIIIDHFQHIHKPIRDDTINKIMYEGPLNPRTEIVDYPLLSTNLISLF